MRVLFSTNWYELLHPCSVTYSNSNSEVSQTIVHVHTAYSTVDCRLLLFLQLLQTLEKNKQQSHQTEQSAVILYIMYI